MNRHDERSGGPVAPGSPFDGSSERGGRSRTAVTGVTDRRETA